MKSRFLSLLLIFLSTLFIYSCKTIADQPIEPTLKIHANDPFKETIVSSQFFNINGNEDHVLKGKQGTVMVFSKGCFKNSAGKLVTENITIELAEAFSLKDILFSNLTTTSNGKQLITDGMIYFNATADGKQLIVNKDIPVYIEIPTNERKPDMQVYKGERDENGNMNWVEPKELETFLTTVDLDLLNFYPKGFEAAVEANMPYKNHEYASKELKDSLFYSLSYFNLIQMKKILGSFSATNFNEAYYNEYKEIINGKYTDKSFETNSIQAEVDSMHNSDNFYGIDPALIKVIRSEPFQNSLIATREFEKRLSYIYESCQNSILEIYSKNLDKNMWELDEMVAEKISTWSADTLYSDSDPHGHTLINDSNLEKIFREFSAQKLTNIKDNKKYSVILKSYYEKKLKEVQLELETKQKEFVQKIKKENEEAKKVTKEYKDLLFKRETHRMEKYGFEWTDTGWINVDTGTIPKGWGPKKLEVFVKNGSEYDRVHTYVIYSSIESLYRLNSTDNELFHVGNKTNKEMNMPKKKQATIITIAYQNKNIFIGKQDFITGDPSIVINLFPSSEEEMSEAIKRYDNYAAENNISEDLKYMEIFEMEKKRQEALNNELVFIQSLAECIYNCSYYYYLG